MVAACPGRCRAIVDSGSSVLAGPTQVGHSIFKHINPNPKEKNQVKGHATGSFLGSAHTKDHLGQPPSCFLSQLDFMRQCQDPASYYLHCQWHGLPSVPQILPPEGERTTLGSGSQVWDLQELLGFRWGEGTLYRPSHTMADAAEPLWLGQCLPQNQPRESEGPSGTSILLN